MAGDLYVLLGLGPDANLSQVNRAFRALSHQFDPDRPGADKAAAERLRALTGAFETLRSTSRRADYERERQGRRRGGDAAARAQPVTAPIDLFDDFESYRPGRQEMTDRWTENFTGRPSRKSHPVRELNVELALSPEQALRGGSVPIEFPVARLCPRCAGSGVDGYFSCELCDGHGMDWRTARVDVLLSPPVQDGQVTEVSLRHLGVENFYLRVHTRVAAGKAPRHAP